MYENSGIRRYVKLEEVRYFMELISSEFIKLHLVLHTTLNSFNIVSHIKYYFFAF